MPLNWNYFSRRSLFSLFLLRKKKKQLAVQIDIEKQFLMDVKVFGDYIPRRSLLPRISYRLADLLKISSCVVPFSELKKQRSLNSPQLTTDLTAEVTTKQKPLCRAVLPIRLDKVSVCHF